MALRQPVTEQSTPEDCFFFFSDCRDHGHSLLGPNDPLHPEEIVLGVQNATSHVRSVDSVVEEGEREKFGEELGVIGWTVENEIPNPTDFVPAKREEKR